MDNKTLAELAKEAQRAYQKEWRAKNKDKVRKHTQDYWIRWAERRAKEGEANEQ